MTSMPEPHIDRTEEPILTGTDGYSPKRVRWPGVLAVVVLVAAAIGGVVVTDREDRKQGNGAPDRSTNATAPQPPQAEPANTPQRDDQKDAQAAKAAAPR